MVPASGLVARSATDATPNGDGILVATAKCPGRKHVVSGGFKAEDNAVPVVSRAVGDRKWTVHLFPGSTEPLKTVAYCGARRVSRHSKTKAADADTQVANKVAAKCDRGESVVSGGFRLIDTPPGDLDNNPVFKSRRTGKRTWGVSAFVDEPPAKVKAFAYCTRHLDVKVRSNQSDPIPTRAPATRQLAATGARRSSRADTRRRRSPTSRTTLDRTSSTSAPCDRAPAPGPRPPTTTATSLARSRRLRTARPRPARCTRANRTPSKPPDSRSRRCRRRLWRSWTRLGPAGLRAQSGDRSGTVYRVAVGSLGGGQGMHGNFYSFVSPLGGNLVSRRHAATCSREAAPARHGPGDACVWDAFSDYWPLPPSPRCSS